MSLEPHEIRNVMSHFATGVTVLTTKSRTGMPFGLTANALTSLSLDPPLLLVCIDKRAQCYSCFEESGIFGLNILREEQEDLSRHFATKGIEKFKGIKWHTGEFGVPILDDAMGHIQCKVVRNHDGGDHTIFVGEILGAAATGDRPLLFFKGDYRRLPSP